MIKITKNQVNNLIFTLNEKTTISDAKYLLEIHSNQNHNSTVVRLSGDTSANVNRYNEFQITDGPTEDLENGIVNLIAGTYDYFAWQTSGSTLDLSGATSIVESGKLVVNGSGTTSTTYNDSNDEFTFI